MRLQRLLIGIDEAGRGPLAGPVSVGVFAVTSKKILDKFRGVKDSKQLTEKKREEWLDRIDKEVESGNAFYSVKFSSAKIIDEKGISFAIRNALARALDDIDQKIKFDRDSLILLDGLLHAPAKFTNQKTIIGGDASEPIIALASICAKVLRDRKMRIFAKKYPVYSFEIHKGYGTKKHYDAIKKYGVSEIHRKTYLKNSTDIDRSS
jgi:ribonuclease HII